MKALKVLLCSGLVLMATSAYAKKKPMIKHVDENMSGQGYGMAGCGLGSIVFGNQPGMVQIFAVTTNGTFGTQTFGISSGTSNCTDDGMVAQNKEVPMFIEANQIALATDIARGSGETLESLNKVLGCSDSNAVNAKLQENYRAIFSTKNIKDMTVTNSILDVLKNDAKASQDCKNLI